MKPSLREKFILCGGVSLIVIGIIANPWVLSKMIASDIVFSTGMQKIIWSLDILTALLGSTILYLRHRIELWTNLFLLSSIFAAGILACEILLRLTDPLQMMKIYRENPSRMGSYRLKPNINVIIRGTEIKTNSFGMRWHEVSMRKPSRKKRIAFVGDSYTFGCWADTIENSFAGVFDHTLRENVDVLNFGIPGYGFQDMELLIQEEVLPFQPDVIILISYVGNDFLENCEGLNHVTVEEGSLKKTPSNRPELNPLLLKSSIYQLCLRVFKRFTAYRVDEFTPYVSWSKEKYSAEQSECMRQAFLTLERIKVLCDRNHIQLLLSAIPIMQQVTQADLFKEGYNIELPQKYIEEFSYTRSIPYLDLAPDLRNAYKETKLLYVRDGHLHNHGHAVIGKALVNFFSNADRSISDGSNPNPLRKKLNSHKTNLRSQFQPQY